ncbi:hypothetical protein [Stagnimonas aquatica]|uniref:hypothetical protein n=1 Tax=Stagnimonas aquatica TaxID=2689987 RepID=UPI0011CDAAF5|nr:hypothetical protein [Stagnimonas aquatica]
MSRKIAWSFLAVAPIVALVCFEVFVLLQGYNGRCGLLDAGWDCSKTEYVSSVMLSPFFLPVLFICGGGWLLFLLLAGLGIRTYRRRQRVAT